MKLNIRILEESVLLVIVVLAAVAMLALSFYNATGLPEVHIAFPTRECVKVVSETPGPSCDNLPDKYHVVYVAPRF